MCLRQWPGSVSLLLSVSLFKFITWDKSQLVGLGIPLRFIAKPSYSGHCASTHDIHDQVKPSPEHFLAVAHNESSPYFATFETIDFQV
jgi:hypothetical protein